MAAVLHNLDQRRLIDTNGIADGAEIFFYLTGTLTPSPVYTTSALNVEHPSPIVVAAGAAVPDIYLESTVTYRRRIVYPDGGVDDTDPYSSLAALGVVTAAGESLQTVIDSLPIRPEEVGAIGDQITDDTDAINDAIALISGSRRTLQLDGDYLISSVLMFEDLSDFKIIGTGSIKIADGTPTHQGYSAFEFSNCENFHVEGIVIDGNRAGRTPAEASGQQIRVDGCRNFKFERVASNNATTDGFRIDALDGADIATYCDNGVFEDCSADNAYRNGMSVISGFGIHVVRGHYTGSNGTLPKAGVDWEPNVSNTYGLIGFRMIDVDTSDNDGYGCLAGGLARVSGEIRGHKGTGNGFGLASIGEGCDKVTYQGSIDTDAEAITRGMVDIGNGADNIDVSVEFENITTTDNGSRYCLYIHSGATNVRVSKCHGKTISLPLIFDRSPNSSVRDVNSVDCTAGGSSISADTGAAKSTWRGVTAIRSTGQAIDILGANVKLEGFYVEDCDSTTAAVRVRSGATDPILRAGHVHETTSIPGGQVGLRPDLAMKELGGFEATGGYTSTNVVTNTASSFLGTKVYGVSPDPFSGTATIDIASLAAGATATATVAFTMANTTDRVHVQPLGDLLGIEITAWVSATGTITYRKTNGTSGAVDPASMSITFALPKA